MSTLASNSPVTLTPPGRLPPNAGRDLFIVSAVAAFSGFLFGYDLVIISGAQIFLRSHFELNDVQFAFATTSAIIGCIVGPFFGAYASDRIGRERTMFFSAILLVISACVTALAPDISLFNVFRITGGLSVGICSVAAPMYIAEVAPPRVRGALGVMYQLAIVLGCIASGIVAWLLARSLPDMVSWRWMLGSQLLPAACFAALTFVIPRSPRWLAEKGLMTESLATLSRFNTPEQASMELELIRTSLAEQAGGFRELFNPAIRRTLLIGIALAFFNNWTGWSAMGYYIPVLFQKAGFTNASDAIFQSIIVNGWATALTLASMVLVDRVGRRPLWIAGSAMMIVALTVIGFVFKNNLTGLPVLFAILFCAAPHAFALGPLPWLMMSELYPTRIRAQAVATTTTFLWIAGWTGPMIFPILMGYFEKRTGSVGPAFWVFAGVCCLSLIFGIRFLPETKGRSLEKIAQEWRTK